MCGIVGVVLKNSVGFTNKSQGAFFEMLYIDALRGFDSTGLIMAERTADFHIMKAALPAAEFIPKLKKHALSTMMWNSGRVAIGHNRKATVGEVKDESAHPFVVDKTFAMVHNGTLYTHKHLADVTVDSEALAIHLKKAVDIGTKEAWEESLGAVNGAYAIAAYDQKKNQVFLLRNKDRPLAIVENDDGWFFASEWPLLEYVLWRAGYARKESLVYEVTENVLYTINVEKKTLDKQDLTIKKYTPSNNKSQPGSNGCSGDLPIASSPVTERMFRKLKNKHLGKTLKFWCNDYVELDFPNDIARGSTQVCLFGRQKKAAFRHVISADVDLTKFHFTGKPEELIHREWIGVIEAMSYNEVGQAVTVTLADCKPVITLVKSSKPAVKELEDYEDSLTVMRDSELLKLSMDTCGELKSWQLEAIRKELAIRAEVDNRRMNESSITFH